MRRGFGPCAFVLPCLFALALPLAAATLQERLQAAIDAAPPSVRGWAAIQVVDLANGNTLFSQNQEQLLLPASNLKLFTVALALTHLGSDYRFTTRLIRTPSGDLTIVGAGDPSLSARIYPSDDPKLPKNALQSIEALADQAVASGLTRVDGDVIGDDSRYLWDPYPASWTADDLAHEYGAPVSALTFNDNLLAISVRPGTGAGQLAKVTLTPPVEYFAINNQITTVAGRATIPMRMRLVPGTRQILLTGTIAANSAATSEPFPVDVPALFTATALYDALLRRGVAIHGRPASRHRVSGTGLPPEIAGELLASRRSPSLFEILTILEKSSQNLHTEMILREVGSVFRKDGSLTGGLREMSAYLPTLGINPKEVMAEDAAGLARNDEVTARAMTQLLQSMYASPFKDVWLSFLPVGGEDGTLSNRLGGSGGKIRAKTGTLARAVSLSGYVDSKTSGMLAFSILVNNFAAPIADARAWVDKLASTLVE